MGKTVRRVEWLWVVLALPGWALGLSPVSQPVGPTRPVSTFFTRQSGKIRSYR